MSFSNPEELNKLAKEFEAASADEEQAEVITEVPSSNIVCFTKWKSC